MICFRAISSQDEQSLLEEDKIIAKGCLDPSKDIKQQLTEYVRNGSKAKNKPFFSASYSPLTMIKYASNKSYVSSKKKKNDESKRAKVFAIALPEEESFNNCIFDANSANLGGGLKNFNEADRELIFTGNIELGEGQVITRPIELSNPKHVSVSSECMFEMHPLLLDYLNLVKGEGDIDNTKEITEDIEHSIISRQKDKSQFSVKHINEAIAKMASEGVFNELEIKFIKEYFINCKTIDEATKDTFQIENFTYSDRLKGQCLRTQITKKFASSFFKVKEKDLDNILGFLEADEGRDSTKKKRPCTVFTTAFSRGHGYVEKDQRKDKYQYKSGENIAVGCIRGDSTYKNDINVCLPVGMRTIEIGISKYKCLPILQKVVKEYKPVDSYSNIWEYELPRKDGKPYIGPAFDVYLPGIKEKYVKGTSQKSHNYDDDAR